jgi:pimeloyl-ACP methyl ester carboxylesterase
MRLLLFLLAAPLAHSLSFQHQPRPYKVKIDKNFIENTRVRASQFRPSLDFDGPKWFDGPSSADVSNVAKYWAKNFDFNRFQNEINKNFTHYMTTIPAPGGRYNRPLDIHFFHQLSKRHDAIPMLLLHGWPSTSLEWAKVIPDLVNPRNASLPAFHAIAPDLPGFGFSPAPLAPGLGAEEHAIVFGKLMQQLGYDRYAIYSTDLGFIVARRMTEKYSDRILNHATDFYAILPSTSDQARLATNETTGEETAYMQSISAYLAQYSAYVSIQSTLPLSLAHALYDSPVGFLAWVWQVVYTLGGMPETAEELIRRTIPLYVSGPYGNIRSYKELFGELVSYFLVGILDLG